MSIANELGVYHMVGQFLVNLPKKSENHLLPLGFGRQQFDFLHLKMSTF